MYYMNEYVCVSSPVINVEKFWKPGVIAHLSSLKSCVIFRSIRFLSDESIMTN